MTFEEMQAIIAQMLSVQRELQESDLRQREEMQQQREETDRKIAIEREEWRARQEALESQMTQIMSVQRDLQEGFLQLQSAHIRNFEGLNRLEGIVDRLIGYSIANETDHLNLEERMNNLERQFRRLHPNNG
jgi:hypothetical protein